MHRDNMPTKTPEDLRLDELLILWHRHRAGYQFSSGYSGSDSTCRDYRTPGHWDWQNGAADARADAITAKGVEDAAALVPNQPKRWNTALAFEARNLASGAAVWTSPVLPRDPEERAILVLEARNMLARELMRAGVLG
jgi:hypothetical protein